MQFVIGHEYGHLLLKHLDRNAAGGAPLGVIPGFVQRRLQYYTPHQEQELAADAAALLDPVIDDKVLADRLMGAIWFFLGLELLYGVAGFIKNSPLVSKTHPPPIDRLWVLNEAVLTARPAVKDFAYSHIELDEMVGRTLRLKGTLLEHFFPNNRHQLEVYGSIYLPTFRGQSLADHIDY
ncbi:Uncharacterised protein [Streptococcus dysgalactiae subsp. equisimilis]|nr:Uncharacterised protein [Streptococcus dysgalactiae subsp. equisimilis]